MKIKRDGAKLMVTLSSGIGFTLTFTHECHSDGDAEAWRVHLQNEQDRVTNADSLDNDRMKNRICELNGTVQALRGHVTRLKRRTP